MAVTLIRGFHELLMSFAGLHVLKGQCQPSQQRFPTCMMEVTVDYSSFCSHLVPYLRNGQQ